VRASAAHSASHPLPFAPLPATGALYALPECLGASHLLSRHVVDVILERMWRASELLGLRRDTTRDDFVAKSPWPVLVCRPRTTEGPDGTVVESTEIGGALQTRADAKLGPTSLVYAVKKRPGGAFAERIGVGRSKGTDVWFALPEVSKYHAYFVFAEADRTWAIADAGSSNGTFVDGKPVGVHELTVLRSGCVVRLGSHPFRFFTPEGFYRELGELVFGPSRP
jgi:hypothetical protein